MNRSREISRFKLYGERDGAIAPEFVHIEPISQRARLHEGMISPHAHPGIFQMLLLEAGTGMVASDGDEAHLQAGALVALPSGCVHAFRFSGDAEGWVLSIAADLLNDPRIAGLCAAARVPGAKARWVQAGTAAGQLARMSWLLADFADAVVAERSGHLADAVAARLALLLALAEEALALGAVAVAVPARGGRRETIAQRFRALVELHFRDDWAVSDYARALATTTPTLTRSCREVLGKAPNDAALDRLLLEAMRSLTYTAAPVSQIADDLGFSDTAYFARFFKSRSGMTATAFRAERAWLSGAGDIVATA